MSDLSDSLLRGGMMLPHVTIWQTSVSRKSHDCTKESMNAWVDCTSVIALFQKLI
jgi:hypothetical protein